MKKRLYFIGNIFVQNDPFREYILREVEAENRLDATEFFSDANRDFFAELEYQVRKDEHIYIISDKKSFTLVGKLLCSITDDKLVLKEKILLPSKCETYTDQSYLLSVKNALVNVVEVQESQELPKIALHSAPSIQKLQFFENDIKKVIEISQPLAKQFDVELSYSQVVEGWITINVKCNTYGSIEKFMEIIKQRYPASVIITDGVVQHIINTLLKRQEKITLAESCTGGLLAYYFTSHAGVSSVFDGSLVTYSNILKENWLAVENSTLVEHGAVSESVVTEMCSGALSISNANYALGVSGIAGPDGGSQEKPVGTVVIGYSSKQSKNVQTHHFYGDRNYVQEQSALMALKMLVVGEKKVFFTN